jgi:hypothetical protein
MFCGCIKEMDFARENLRKMNWEIKLVFYISVIQSVKN